MKYDLKFEFIDFEDTVMKDPKGKNFTLRMALLNAFAAGVNEQGQPVQGTLKMDYYDLYVKVKKAGDMIEFSAADAAQALSAIKGAYPPLIAGQAREILDQKT
jgi:hypothetical protein